MTLRFWGTRAFCPAFFSPERERDRIAAVLKRIEMRDAASDDAKERFFSSLPAYLCEAAGINTICVQVSLESSDDVCLFDAGTGLASFSRADFMRGAKYRIFLSGFGWDSIQGLPFFRAAYDSEREIEICAPSAAAKSLLSRQMEEPFFPLSQDDFRAKVSFATLPDFFAVKVGGAEIAAKKFCAGRAFAYSVSEGGKKIVVAQFFPLEKAGESAAREGFFEGADLLVLDSQCSVEEAVFGGSDGSKIRQAVALAAKFGAKRLVLTRLNPNFDNKKIFALEDFAASEARKAGCAMQVESAREGMEIQI